MYVTCQPCNNCAKMMINAGIERVIYEGEYPDEFSLELFSHANLEVYRLVDNELSTVLISK